MAGAFLQGFVMGGEIADRKYTREKQMALLEKNQALKEKQFNLYSQSMQQTMDFQRRAQEEHELAVRQERNNAMITSMFDEAMANNVDLADPEQYKQTVFNIVNSIDPKDVGQALEQIYGFKITDGALVDPENPIREFAVREGPGGQLVGMLHLNRKDGKVGPLTENRTDQPDDKVVTVDLGDPRLITALVGPKNAANNPRYLALVTQQMVGGPEEMAQADEKLAASKGMEQAKQKASEEIAALDEQVAATNAEIQGKGLSDEVASLTGIGDDYVPSAGSPGPVRDREPWIPPSQRSTVTGTEPGQEATPQAPGTPYVSPRVGVRSGPGLDLDVDLERMRADITVPTNPKDLIQNAKENLATAAENVSRNVKEGLDTVRGWFAPKNREEVAEAVSPQVRNDIEKARTTKDIQAAAAKVPAQEHTQDQAKAMVEATQTHPKRKRATTAQRFSAMWLFRNGYVDFPAMERYLRTGRWDTETWKAISTKNGAIFYTEEGGPASAVAVGGFGAGGTDLNDPQEAARIQQVQENLIDIGKETGFVDPENPATGQVWLETYNTLSGMLGYENEIQAINDRSSGNMQRVLGQGSRMWKQYNDPEGFEFNLFGEEAHPGMFLAAAAAGVPEPEGQYKLPGLGALRTKGLEELRDFADAWKITEGMSLNRRMNVSALAYQLWEANGRQNSPEDYAIMMLNQPQ